MPYIKKYPDKDFNPDHEENQKRLLAPLSIFSEQKQSQTENELMNFYFLNNLASQRDPEILEWEEGDAWRAILDLSGHPKEGFDDFIETYPDSNLRQPQTPLFPVRLSKLIAKISNFKVENEDLIFCRLENKSGYVDSYFDRTCFSNDNLNMFRSQNQLNPSSNTSELNISMFIEREEISNGPQLNDNCYLCLKDISVVWTAPQERFLCIRKENIEHYFNDK